MLRSKLANSFADRQRLHGDFVSCQRQRTSAATALVRTEATTVASQVRCKHATSGIAESTWHRWRSQYGGMKADEAKRLRQLETENARLKKLLAEAELDKAMLKELAEDAPIDQVGAERAA